MPQFVQHETGYPALFFLFPERIVDVFSAVHRIFFIENP